MVTKSRLDWVLQQLLLGRQCRCRVNSHAGKITVHIVLTGTVASDMQNSIPMFLVQGLGMCLEQYVTVDHGHRNSAAESHCSFVFKLPTTSDSVEGAGVAAVPECPAQSQEQGMSSHVADDYRFDVPDTLADEHPCEERSVTASDPKRLRLDESIQPPNETEIHWFTLADEQCRVYNQHWRLHAHARRCYAARNYDEAFDMVTNEYADKIRAIDGLCGKYRTGAHLSWAQLEQRGFKKTAFFDYCCKRFHRGSMDPRGKSDEFYEVFVDMQKVIGER
mmetsp:Transcript_60857/g.117272  ORF Transcript_60857/g.117272 Transcript_60857/m.117272 type:complete len:277 (-) Transcript_60857:24-854(-)